MDNFSVLFLLATWKKSFTISGGGFYIYKPDGISII